VEKKFNVTLIPEIEVAGDWDFIPEFLRNQQASKAVKE